MNESHPAPHTPRHISLRPTALTLAPRLLHAARLLLLTALLLLPLSPLHAASTAVDLEPVERLIWKVADKSTQDNGINEEKTLYFQLKSTNSSNRNITQPEIPTYGLQIKARTHGAAVKIAAGKTVLIRAWFSSPATSDLIITKGATLNGNDKDVRVNESRVYGQGKNIAVKVDAVVTVGSDADEVYWLAPGQGKDDMYLHMIEVVPVVYGIEETMSISYAPQSIKIEENNPDPNLRQLETVSMTIKANDAKEYTFQVPNSSLNFESSDEAKLSVLPDGTIRANDNLEEIPVYLSFKNGSAEIGDDIDKKVVFMYPGLTEATRKEIMVSTDNTHKFADIDFYDNDGNKLLGRDLVWDKGVNPTFALPHIKCDLHDGNGLKDVTYELGMPSYQYSKDTKYQLGIDNGNAVWPDEALDVVVKVMITFRHEGYTTVSRSYNLKIITPPMVSWDVSPSNVVYEYKENKDGSTYDVDRGFITCAGRTATIKLNIADYDSKIYSVYKSTVLSGDISDDFDPSREDKCTYNGEKALHVRYKIEKQGDGEHKFSHTIHFRFDFKPVPTITVTPKYDKENRVVEATVTMTKVESLNGGESVSDIYYTIDSTNPMRDDTDEKSTKPYTGPITVTTSLLFAYAQFITVSEYYTGKVEQKEDGTWGQKTSTEFALQPDDEAVEIYDPEVIYAKEGKGETPGTSIAPNEVRPLNTFDADGNPVVIMNILYGTNYVKDTYPVFFNESETYKVGGVEWSEASSGSAVNSHIDVYRYSHNGTTPPKVEVNGAHQTPNANPRTENNGAIGGVGTENGGLFLNPMSGAFVRFEPEYDGVVSVWLFQNGSTESNSIASGTMPRRPVFFVDENGWVIPRTTVQPTATSYYCVDGTFGIVSQRSTFTDDFELTWKTGLDRWDDPDFPESDRENYRFLCDVYNWPMVGDKPARYIKRNEKMGDVKIDPSSRVIYIGEYMAAKGMKGNFSKYGYEIPHYNYVRYRLPVRAGKSYYVGGRGTKIGVAAIKFEPLPPNYDPADYRVKGVNKSIEDIGGENPKLELKELETGKDTPPVRNEAEIFAEYKGIGTYLLSEDGDKKWLEAPGNGATALQEGTTINLCVERSFEAGKWHPIVLPCTVNETRMREIFGEDVMVIYLDGDPNSSANSRKWYVKKMAVDGDVLKFTRHYYQMLYANVPAFICPSKINPDYYDSEKKRLTLNRVTFEGWDILEYEIGDGFKVTGSYAPTTAAENGEMYYLSNVQSGADKYATVYHAPDGQAMKATRVWVKASPSSRQLRRIGMQTHTTEPEGDGGVGGSGLSEITDIAIDPILEDDDDPNVYDIMGRIVGRESLQGLPPGIYIFHGRKIAVRP